MIVKGLQAIINEFRDENSAPEDAVMGIEMVLGNVSQEESLTDSGKIIVTLVNIEEDKVLKNGSFNTLIDGSMTKHNPLIHLNLYVLFSAMNDNYLHGLIQMQRVLTFFQGKNVFNQQNTVFDDERVEKLIFDLHTLTFEQINHLWGVLGGKQYPAILYKVRLVVINAEKRSDEAVIEAITDNTTAL